MYGKRTKIKGSRSAARSPATALLAASVLSWAFSSPAQAGYVQDWLDSKGGCSPGPLQLMGSYVRPGARKLLGRTTEEWTDADLEELEAVYSKCARRFPVTVVPVIDPSEADIQRSVDELMHAARSAVQDAREELRAREARLNAQRSIAERQAESAQERLRQRATRDRAEAEEVARRAEAEAPLLSQLEREATEAKRAREAAEQRLSEVRRRADELGAQARSEASAARRAEADTEATVQSERQKIEDEKLARPCKVTLAQFNDISFGMVPRDVERRLGCKGKQLSATKVGSDVLAVFGWEGASFPSSVTVTFANNRLHSKAELGL